MGIGKIYGSLTEFLKKYRYVMLVLMIGILFLIMPETNNREKAETDLNDYKIEESKMDIGEELEKILGQVDGAGAVKVMVSVAKGARTIYQTDVNSQISETNSTEKIDTVLITSSDKNQSGLVSRIDPPEYLGVIVLCQGADSAIVRLALVDAVAKATGLGTDNISVLKMK